MPLHSSRLRRLFGALNQTDRFEALVTALEVLDKQRDYEVTLSKSNDVHYTGSGPLEEFEKELLENSCQEVRRKFLDSMVIAQHLKVIPRDEKTDLAPGDEEDHRIDPSLLTAKMSQADRFRLAALVLEHETPRVPFTSGLVVNRVLNEWASQEKIPDEEAKKLPDHLAFGNPSTTVNDLVTSKDLQCVENMQRGSLYRLTEKGRAAAKGIISKLNSQ